MKHRTVMSALSAKRGVDSAYVILDVGRPNPDDSHAGEALVMMPPPRWHGPVAGKILTTHIGQTNLLTLWDWTGDHPDHPIFQTARGKWCSDAELIAGMTFCGVTLREGEWRHQIQEAGFTIVEVV